MAHARVSATGWLHYLGVLQYFQGGPGPHRGAGAWGRQRWRDRRKLKGIAVVRLKDGSVHTAEIHWYEAHGLGRKEFKLKMPFLD